MLEHYHIFEYRVEKSDVEGCSPCTVKFEISGDVNLQEMLEKFESYLKAVGFVISDNQTLDLVDK
jgi:hypothetical protein